MALDILQSIRGLLDANGVQYRLVRHEPTYTSEQSAEVRGESIRIGGKAILMKTDEIFRLFVISAELRIDSKAIKKHLGVSNLRFANSEELLNLTGLVPGSVPPFGKPILPFDLCADPSIFENDRIAFNAGSLTDSLVMSSADYRGVARPVVFPFAHR
jgi:Ala-tRNA(Pro) deacylase